MMGKKQHDGKVQWKEGIQGLDFLLKQRNSVTLIKNLSSHISQVMKNLSLQRITSKGFRHQILITLGLVVMDDRRILHMSLLENWHFFPTRWMSHKTRVSFLRCRVGIVCKLFVYCTPNSLWQYYFCVNVGNEWSKYLHVLAFHTPLDTDKRQIKTTRSH